MQQVRHGSTPASDDGVATSPSSSMATHGPTITTATFLLDDGGRHDLLTDGEVTKFRKKY